MFDRIALSDLWLGQGKWLSGAADYIVCDGYSSLSYSVVMGLISIAIFSAILVDIFSVKSTALAAGIGGILATFLSVMQIIIYNVEIYLVVALMCLLSLAAISY